MVFRYWRKGSKVDHLVWNGDPDRTFCGLKVYQDTRRLPNMDNWQLNACKKCEKIYVEGYAEREKLANRT